MLSAGGIRRRRAISRLRPVVYNAARIWAAQLARAPDCSRISQNHVEGILSVRTNFAAILTLYVLMSATSAIAEPAGDAAAGKTKAIVCAACHGADGNSSNPQWPKIAGQGERYLVAQLQAFKAGASGPRQGASAATMYGMAAGLSGQDMADLAAYFSAQKVLVGTADPALVKKGEAIYRGGNPDFGSAACIGCHGPNGHGNPPAGFPAVSGQHAEYSFGQLKAFHDGTRSGDPNAAMRSMVRKMSTEEMRAVAEYMQGLH